MGPVDHELARAYKFEQLADVRFGAHSGLKSDTAARSEKRHRTKPLAR